MSKETASSSRIAYDAKGGSSRGCLLIVIAVAGVAFGAIAGAVIGIAFSGSLQRMMGMKAADSSETGSAASGEPAPAKQLWTCGMHPQVIQDKPGICPICHMDLTPMQATPAATGPAPSGASGSSGQRKIKYWWDPVMNPPYISDQPGKSPMGMDLVPVYEDETRSAFGAAVVIDPVIVQNMGVRTAAVKQQPLHRSIRAVGYLKEAQPNIRDVNLLVNGWIRHLHADTEGMRVQQGDPLFDLYSPELQVAIEEAIAARRAIASISTGAEDVVRKSTQSFSDAAARKLELWGLPREQIEALAKLDRAPETITFTSPIDGIVTEKPIAQGAAVKAGDRALRIVDFSTLWLDVKVFEKDLPLVRMEQRAKVSIASRPGEHLDGQIIFIDPRIDEATRTATVRLAIPNEALNFKPGMYATVRIEVEIAAQALVVPREAIIDTGDRQVAFVMPQFGHFEPRRIVMGEKGDDGQVQVLDGLAAGENVVTSGQFLIDSESRLREAIQKFLSEKTQMSATSPAPAAAPPMRQQEPTGQATPAAPAVAGETPAELASKVDAVVRAYLRMSEALGAPQTNDAPLDGESLAAAAHDLHAALLATPDKPLAVNIANAGEALKREPLDKQRETFKPLSDAVIALVEKYPPSSAIGDKLYVMYCPMAPGHWMQTIDRVNNPFYATQMKQCGELARTIATVRNSGGGGGGGGGDDQR